MISALVRNPATLVVTLAIGFAVEVNGQSQPSAPTNLKVAEGTGTPIPPLNCADYNNRAGESYVSPLECRNARDSAGKPIRIVSIDPNHFEAVATADGSAKFDGSNYLIRDASFPTHPLTVVLWAKASRWGGALWAQMREDYGWAGQYLFSLGDGGLQMAQVDKAIGSDSMLVAPAGTLKANEWNLIVAEFRVGEPSRLTVNNAVTIEGNLAKVGPVTTMTLGAIKNGPNEDHGGYFFAGEIDALGLFGPYTLTTTDKEVLWNRGAGVGYKDIPQALRGHLVDWWSLDNPARGDIGRFAYNSLLPVLGVSRGTGRLVEGGSRPLAGDPLGAIGSERAIAVQDIRYESLPAALHPGESAFGAFYGATLSGKNEWEWIVRTSLTSDNDRETVLWSEQGSDGSKLEIFLTPNGRPGVRAGSVAAVSTDTLHGEVAVESGQVESIRDNRADPSIEVTLSFSTPHRFASGDQIRVSGCGAPFDGVYPIARGGRKHVKYRAGTLADVGRTPQLPCKVSATGRYERAFYPDIPVYNPRRLALRIVRNGDLFSYYVRGELISETRVSGFPLGPNKDVTSHPFGPRGAAPSQAPVERLEVWNGALAAGDARALDISFSIAPTRTRGYGPLAVQIDGSELPFVDRMLTQDARVEFVFRDTHSGRLASSWTNTYTGQSYARPTGVVVSQVLGTGNEKTPVHYDMELSVQTPPYDLDGQPQTPRMIWAGKIYTITILPWGADTQTLYVSSSDPNRSDDHSGTDPARPLSTIGKAFERCRPGTRVLLKRGDYFDSLGRDPWQLDFGGGRKLAERTRRGPILLSSYGDGDARPQLGRGVSFGHLTNDVRVSGIDIDSRGGQIRAAITITGSTRGVLIHDMNLRGFESVAGASVLEVPSGFTSQFVADSINAGPAHSAYYGIFGGSDWEQSSFTRWNLEWHVGGASHFFRQSAAILPEWRHIIWPGGWGSTPGYTASWNIRIHTRFWTAADSRFHRHLGHGGISYPLTLPRGVRLERIIGTEIKTENSLGATVTQSYGGSFIELHPWTTGMHEYTRAYANRVAGSDPRIGLWTHPMDIVPLDGAFRNLFVKDSDHFGTLEAPSLTVTGTSDGFVTLVANGSPLGGKGYVKVGWERAAAGLWQPLEGAGALYVGDRPGSGAFQYRTFVVDETGLRANGPPVAVTVN